MCCSTVRNLRPVAAGLAIFLACLGCVLQPATAQVAPAGVEAARPPGASASFPAELIQFTPYADNPILTGAGEGHWDVKIRERGWILREGDLWRLWYSGYDGTRPGKKMLGLATSRDGLHWERDPRNPIYSEHWCEDMMIVPHHGTYYMFAEGAQDQAQLLTSNDGVTWIRRGKLDIRQTNGEPLTAGPRGTPTAWHEAGVWYLFYERMDRGVWLATSRDLDIWQNVQDEPVLLPGPEAADRHAIALNQVIRHDGAYYAYYHGSDTPDWREWSVNLARSSDLIHWEKYPGNPLMTGNQSSGIVVPDGQRYRLYTMHNEVRAYLPSKP